MINHLPADSAARCQALGDSYWHYYSRRRRSTEAAVSASQVLFFQHPNRCGRDQPSRQVLWRTLGVFFARRGCTTVLQMGT